MFRMIGQSDYQFEMAGSLLSTRRCEVAEGIITFPKYNTASYKGLWLQSPLTLGSPSARRGAPCDMDCEPADHSLTTTT